MSTRWLAIIVAGVFAAVLVITLVATRGDEIDGGSPAPGPSSPLPATSAPSAVSPSPSAPSGSPTPAVTAVPAAGFAATGDLVSGWYWLRDDASADAATWDFPTLPDSGDLIFVVEVLATDAVDGARGQSARFYFAWGPGGSEWFGRLPVTLPNVSPLDDPVGYTCRGTVSVPRSTISDAVSLTVRISRDDVRGELDPTDVHVAVNASSVKLRQP